MLGNFFLPTLWVICQKMLILLTLNRIYLHLVVVFRKLVSFDE